MNTNEHPADRIYKFLQSYQDNKFSLNQIKNQLQISHGVAINAIRVLSVRNMINKKYDGRFIYYYVE